MYAEVLKQKVKYAKSQENKYSVEPKKKNNKKNGIPPWRLKL